MKKFLTPLFLFLLFLFVAPIAHAQDKDTANDEKESKPEFEKILTQDEKQEAQANQEAQVKQKGDDKKEIKSNK